jgi:DNA polymerase III subunit epsilon
MIILFDTETTGVPRNYKAPATDTDNWPRLVQLAFIVLHGETLEQLESYEAIIKPEGFTIPKEASDIHGVTTERALAEGIPLVDAVSAFNNAINKCDTIIAHNISFDEKIMGAEMVRTKLFPIKTDRKKICTMQASTDFCALPGPYGFKWPKLIELHEKLFGVGFEGAHSALVDVEALARCYVGLLTNGIIK